MNILVRNMRKTNPLVFPQNRGVSDAANDIQRETEELQQNISRSITFGDHLSEMMERLFETKQEHAINNWDGYGAKAIDEQSYKNSTRFILSLTPDIPIPEIGVEPDGEVVFEWYGGKRNVFSISMGSRNELTYAGLYGISKTYGVEHFYENVPDTLLDNINRVFSGRV
ncbi:MAG: hypothetical protein Q8P44_07305 [Dehalococcoidia bacterium]|nr:hypothetical protein [Dehalococcoidia bacterium]